MGCGGRPLDATNRRGRWLCFLIATLIALAGSGCVAPSPGAGPAQSRPSVYLIITADDYGASENITRGIEFAAIEGSISEISVLANFPEGIARLQDLRQSAPQVGIGVHLNLTTGRPVLGKEAVPTLVDRDGRFLSVERFYARMRRISLDEVEAELRAQISALTDNGIALDHVSDHNGLLSIDPVFFQLMAELAAEHGLAARSPVAASVVRKDIFPGAVTRRKGLRTAVGIAARNPVQVLRLARYTSAEQMRLKSRHLDDRGVLHPRELFDVFYGTPTAENALRILRSLPSGCSEIVLHLGDDSRWPEYPTGLDLTYFDRRESELAVATSSYLRQCAATLNLHLVGFHDLAWIVNP